jgi:hypothetical protein
MTSQYHLYNKKPNKEVVFIEATTACKSKVISQVHMTVSSGRFGQVMASPGQ